MVHGMTGPWRRLEEQYVAFRRGCYRSGTDGKPEWKKRNADRDVPSSILQQSSSYLQISGELSRHSDGTPYAKCFGGRPFGPLRKPLTSSASSLKRLA